MRVKHFFVVFFIFCSLFVLMCSCLRADGLLSEVDEFSNFSLMSNDKEKVNCLSLAFELRMKHAKNLSYKVEVGLGARKFNNFLGAGGVDGATFRSIYEHKIFNNSYTMRIEALQGERDWYQKVSTFFDGKEGITKGYVNAPPNTVDAFLGRIDTVADPILRENYYISWLSDNFQTEFHRADYFLFPCLLRHKDQWKIESNNTERVIKLTSPYPQRFVADKFDGTRVLTLEPQKGFMPLGGEFRWEATRRGGNRWYEEKFAVEDSRLIGDVWMPIKMMSWRRTSEDPENEFFAKLTVKEIIHGQVSETDMTIRFPKGTFIVDAIEGISYKTDANGNPIESTAEYLYDLDPTQANVPLPEPKNRTVNYVLIVIGIVLILIALYMMLYQRRRNAS